MSDIETALAKGIAEGKVRYKDSKHSKDVKIAFTLWDLMGRHGEFMKALEARIEKEWK